VAEASLKNDSSYHLERDDEGQRETIPMTESQPGDKPKVDWYEARDAAENYRILGEALAESGDLFRSTDTDGGLLLIRNGVASQITKGGDLFPVIVDRVELSVIKPKSITNRIEASHLNAMLRTEAFLGAFRPVDRITSVPSRWRFESDHRAAELEPDHGL